MHANEDFKNILPKVTFVTIFLCLMHIFNVVFFYRYFWDMNLFSKEKMWIYWILFFDFFVQFIYLFLWRLNFL